MLKFKIIKVASVIVFGGLVMTSSAQARHYRHVATYNDYATADLSCVAPQSSEIIYPAPNWEPFFRHHFYRYGPIAICVPTNTVTTRVISVRY